ncbi:hypothetical protein PHYPSEUDO_010641 [Phytophthora pseudosyringae]|uniref:C2H2-type domain-containing protein n=1 Tax=Phytophthora pseudosyringae TaxID=221518 RepID=A0A8T1W7M8_9STRA|nr:hypothetical protein PHYPSEUDO_010641 [Phytophthora pseudosyringae]
MEQIRELPSGKCVRKYSPEHPLFDTGTRLWATKYYQEPASMSQLEEVVGDAEREAPITCRLANCNVSFQSVVAYEEHYEMVHRNICRECSRSFLGLRLLDIHISETHDAFFKILSKKKPMFVCLVDGCPETFQHDDKRSRHLIRVHQYPETFAFHQRHKHKEKGKPGDVKSGERDNVPEVNAETIKKREARKRRRQQKKKKQAKRQDSGMQVDAGAETHDTGEETNNEAEVSDVDMADLEESMRELRIPKNIHFGRKRRF